MTRSAALPAVRLHAWFVQTWMTMGLAFVAAIWLHVGAQAAIQIGAALPQVYDRSAFAEAVHARLPVKKVLVWEGADIDGDGAADFVNPTGRTPRDHDAYGYGAFGASRDGGVREHEGVDYTAVADQPVVAPISGFVTKIGLAYSDDAGLKFVEITNPALGYVARVFYVDPTVAVGDMVRLGHVVGRAHSLQARYPDGMTDHVHMELMGPAGHRLDSGAVLTARYVAKSRNG
jgi:murein DD-endopeptidase MepM/ murein hydrolase activator NlpD